ncbi:hypothetical protein [Fischerella sp. JS2]|uniref:hypothetical protein n=1 Tax=Fischerella sp. JS2 TaxID=2597771 RepID=UPI0028E954DA|nr:hypothetical protein [Fischerella sp. JS2]
MFVYIYHKTVFSKSAQIVEYETRFIASHILIFSNVLQTFFESVLDAVVFQGLDLFHDFSELVLVSDRFTKKITRKVREISCFNLHSATMSKMFSNFKTFVWQDFQVFPSPAIAFT